MPDRQFYVTHTNKQTISSLYPDHTLRRMPAAHRRDAFILNKAANNDVDWGMP
ncbi:hypothetical protein BFAG_03717 [Bacteroides fragilis 3_1_12]|uniref:Uncharacterized protein n=1 Tax=Bacteroides fragilis 3_1_12 TaxID=457424 RepID=A0ABP2JUH7_BACFG|nr:hypothetical protein BFAG_03717 [Bacteroides fragilis 3_1_12]